MRVQGLPRTGQITTAPTANYRAGDDGTFQAGSRVANTRVMEVVSNGDGTATDMATGLTWVTRPELIVPNGLGFANPRGVWSSANDYAIGDLVQGDGSPDNLCYVAVAPSGPGSGGAQEPPNETYWILSVWALNATAPNPTPTQVNWNTAIDNCLALVYAGFDDWRLPNMFALASLLNFIATAPLTFTAVFPTMQITGVDYATSNTCRSTTYCMTVDFNLNRCQISLKTYLFWVRPVRGGIVDA